MQVSALHKFINEKFRLIGKSLGKTHCSLKMACIVPQQNYSPISSSSSFVLRDLTLALELER